MTKIVKFDKPQPNAKMIEVIKIALAEAEAGEFQSIVMVKVRPDGHFVTRSVGTEGSSTRLTVGALAFAMHDIMSNPNQFAEGE